MPSSTPPLHVLLHAHDLDANRLADRVVIVLDILFATSSIVHALAEGAKAVWPARNQDEARQMSGRREGALLAGEWQMQVPEGFAAPTPLRLAQAGIAGRELVYSTSNGTPALLAAASARQVYAAALLNGAAVALAVLRQHPQAPVLLLCAGSLGRFNLEDFYGAGHLVAHLLRQHGYQASDSALAALACYQGLRPIEALRQSRVGRGLANALADEVEYAARLDCIDVVPQLRDGCLTGLAA